MNKELYSKAEILSSGFVRVYDEEIDSIYIRSMGGSYLATYYDTRNKISKEFIRDNKFSSVNYKQISEINNPIKHYGFTVFETKIGVFNSRVGWPEDMIEILREILKYHGLLSYNIRKFEAEGQGIFSTRKFRLSFKDNADYAQFKLILTDYIFL